MSALLHQSDGRPAMQLVAVPSANAEVGWRDALPLIRKMADSSPDLTLPTLWGILRGGGGELWLVGTPEGGHEAAAIVGLKAWGTQTAAFVYGAASNDGRAWESVIPALEAALKARGAHIIIFEGPKGGDLLFPGAQVIRQIYEVVLS